MPTCKGIRYFESGHSGVGPPPVILIHGAGSYYLAWPAGIRRLPGLWVITPDLPGHGGSERKLYPSISAYAERLLAFLDDLGVYHVVLAGHSMGAQIALEMARQAPAQIICLALLSAGLTPPNSPQLDRLIDQPVGADAVRRILWEDFFSAATSVVKREKILGKFTSKQAATLLRDWRVCLDYEVDLKGLTSNLPVLVLCGQEDRIVKPASARALAGSLPKGSFQIISNAGHILTLEQPERIATILAETFQKCFAPLYSAGEVHPLTKTPSDSIL
jgi:pimeloyl-ACP methyl ester carboxylesterase